MICAYDDSERCWVAAGKGPLRPIICEGSSRKAAMDSWHESFEAQQSEEYAMEQQMTALSLQNDPEGEYK